MNSFVKIAKCGITTTWGRIWKYEIEGSAAGSSKTSPSSYRTHTNSRLVIAKTAFREFLMTSRGWTSERELGKKRNELIKHMIQLPLFFTSVWEWPSASWNRKESDISRCDGPAIWLIIYFAKNSSQTKYTVAMTTWTYTLAIKLIFSASLAFLREQERKTSRRIVKISFFDSQSLLTIGQVILILWRFCLWVKWKLFLDIFSTLVSGVSVCCCHFFAHNYSSLMPNINWITGDWVRRSSQASRKQKFCLIAIS